MLEGRFPSAVLLPVLMLASSFAAGQRPQDATRIVSQANRPVANRTIEARNAPRVALHADLSPKITLKGSLPDWVSTARDAGSVPETTTLHLDFILTRAPDLQAAFDTMLTGQQTPGSPFYHVWLTPRQIGELYGPNQADINQLTTWLTAQGFHVDEVTPSRLFVRVSAPAPIAAGALGTQIRMFALQGDATGKLRLSAASEPEIPAAFASIVAGIAGLADSPEVSQHHMEVVPATDVGQPGAQPDFTSSSTGNHYIAPGDFATLYDVPSTYDGTGQRIAIIGRSRVNSADITNFEVAVGLPSRLPNVIIPPLAIDPGITATGDQGEATLDVQRILGTAPGVQADLVIAANGSGGIRTAAQYNVQTLLDPIMTISFGACEALAGAANVNLYAQLFAQAAAEGISVFVSSDDSGAAGCDAHGAPPPSTAQIASINYICSSGFATCVGGTEFSADFANASAYWSSTNSATRSSALSYIPEGAWNEPTRTSTSGVTTYIISATGGGASAYTSKPAFQNGNGVPADGFRDAPDVSFSSSGHDSYFGCYAQSGGGSCVRDPVTGSFSFVGFYGTSAAAPTMAAVTAMLNQKLGNSQGNLNPLLYRLANSGNASVFHDTTVASSGVGNCDVSVPSLCNNSTPSATALTGGLAGYPLTPGYDLATGWGSLDVGNFLLAAAATGKPTVTALTGTSGNIQLTTPTLAFQATVTAVAAGSALPTGTVQFFSNGTALGQPTALVAGNASLTVPNTFSLGTYLVTAAYAGDSTFDASNSAVLTFNVVPGTTADNLVLTASPTTVTTAQFTTFTGTVVGTPGGAVPSGNITFSQLLGGTLFPISTAPLVNGSASTRIVFGGGNYVVQATYTGDATYRAATSASVTVSPTRVATVTVLSGPQNLAVGATAAFTATVSGLSPYFVSFASVSFFDNGALLGSVPLSQGVPPSASSTFITPALSAGTHSLIASYPGDNNALPSTSSPLVLTTAGFTVVPSAPSLTLAAGATQGNSDLLTATSLGGFTGSVALSCSVVYNGAQAAAFPPTCALSATTVALTAAGSATDMLTVSTTLPQTGAAVVHAELASPARPSRSAPLVLFCALIAVFWPAAERRRVRAKLPKLLAFLLCAAAVTGMASLSGCGNSSTASNPHPAPKAGTTPGSYTVMVTASGPSASIANINIALAVQ